jgi:uncharacterized phage-associated protein
LKALAEMLGLFFVFMVAFSYRIYLYLLRFSLTVAVIILIIMESPLAVANYFITKSTITGKPVTLLQRIKLVYLSHAWHLGLTDGTPLLNEPIVAWQYGPVVESVYKDFKAYKSNPINQEATYFLNGKNLPYTLQDASLTTLLDKIWDIYQDWSGIDLSALTHQANTPWDMTWNKQNGKN